MDKAGCGPLPDLLTTIMLPMNRLTLGAFALLAVAANQACSARRVPLPEAYATHVLPSICSGVMEGRVVIEGAVEPLAGVVVHLLDAQTMVVLEFRTTDDLGRFKFHAKPASYVLELGLEGFDRVRQPIELSGDGAEPLEIGLPLGI